MNIEAHSSLMFPSKQMTYNGKELNDRKLFHWAFAHSFIDYSNRKIIIQYLFDLYLYGFDYLRIMRNEYYEI